MPESSPARPSVTESDSTLDLLLTGGTALTADPARPVIPDARIGVRGDRIILLEAGPDLVARTAATRTMDCHGRVVIPGLVNIHTHAALTYVRGVAEDLGFAPAY